MNFTHRDILLHNDWKLTSSSGIARKYFFIRLGLWYFKITSFDFLPKFYTIVEKKFQVKW